jgi:hypothetical protein
MRRIKIQWRMKQVLSCLYCLEACLLLFALMVTL